MVLNNKTTLWLSDAWRSLPPKMSTKTTRVIHVKNLKAIVFLLQLVNSVSLEPFVTPIQNEGVPNLEINGVENVSNNGSTTVGERISSNELSKSVFSTRNIDLSNKQQSFPNGTVEDVMKASKDEGLQNGTKSLQFDSKKEKETAHIHVYTGL